MRIYISGGITGISNFMERFKKAESDITSMGHTPVNPAKLNTIMPEDALWDEYMSVSLCMLNMCDAIYMLTDWQNSRGANQEYGFALGKGLKIVFEEMKDGEIIKILKT